EGEAEDRRIHAERGEGDHAEPADEGGVDEGDEWVRREGAERRDRQREDLAVGGGSEAERGADSTGRAWCLSRRRRSGRRRRGGRVGGRGIHGGRLALGLSERTQESSYRLECVIGVVSHNLAGSHPFCIPRARTKVSF